MLNLKDVHVHIGKLHILQGVNLQVKPGECAALLGRNGVGKTTTLRAIMGLARRSGGTVEFEGFDLASCEPHEIPRRGVGYVPQGRGIFPNLTVLENLCIGLALARCLMMRPKLIILDEPTEGIMPRLVSQIRREIHRINQAGVSILLVEQNVETALKLCPRVFLMEKGAIVYNGTAHELKSKPEIVRRYLGLSKQ